MSHLMMQCKVCSIGLDLPSMTLGHCAGLGDVNATHSSSDAPLSLPRPPTIYLEPREEDLEEAVQDVLSQLDMHCINCFNYSK